ncbi:MAG: CsbD family protein [Actinomycetota bacterium]|nr:CsbD family protein [Actinomycetota bacterium]MDQ6946529.1 CsbD family protein [Actinomycetota bacterium]
MGGEMDETKGRLKEAAGDLTDNDDLKREGKVDKGTGKVKDVVDKVSDKIKGD